MDGIWLTTVLTGLLVAAGVVGSMVPIIPGPLLILGAMALHGVLTGWDGLATAVVALGGGLVALDIVLGIRIPARATSRGAGRRALLGGALGGVVGFFAIPVVGLPVGWVTGVFLTELPSSGAPAAWRATTATVWSFGVTVLVQAAIALSMAVIWGVWAAVLLAR